MFPKNFLYLQKDAQYIRHLKYKVSLIQKKEKENGTCRRKRNVQKKTEHVEENETCRRKRNMQKKTEHVEEKGTCRRKQNMQKKTEHVAGV